MDFQLPEEVPSAPGASASGASKRRAANALPKAVWMYDKKRREIIGVCGLTGCELILASQNVSWVLQRAVALENVKPIVVNTHCNYLGSMFELFTDVELAFRQEKTLLGGPIALQFPEFLGGRWRVFALDKASTQPFLDPAQALRVETPISQARSCGIRPVVVEGLTPLPTMDPGTLEGDDGDAGVDPMEADPHAEPTPDIRSQSVVTASDRLKSLSKLLPSGTVSHIYTPEALLKCLHIDRLLKPSATISQVIEASSALLLDPVEHEAVAKDIRDNKIPLPSIGVLRAARVRLDICSVIFEQRLFLHQDQIFFLLVDSSPQMGIDFLCVIEDSFMLPSAHSVQAWLEIDLNLQNGYTSQVDLMSSLGGGRAGLAKKSLNVANGRLMKSKDHEAFHVRRRKHRGVLSDQGTERGMGDVALSVLSQYATYAPADSPDAFLYPNTFAFPGLLHILYDALENACKANPLYTDFLDDLRTLLAFLTDKMLVTKYKATCLHENDKFTGQQTTHIDWKWEFMSRCLDGAMPKLPGLRQNYNVTKMLHSDSGTPLSSQVIKGVDEMLKKQTFDTAAEMFLLGGHIIEESAQTLETCDCHQDIWQQGWKRKRRVSAMFERTSHKSCCWMGRRLPWFIAKGKNSC